MDTTTSSGTERRQHQQVRDIFVHACDLLAPIVEGNDRTITVSNFAMTHILQENFPVLSLAEIHIVIATVEKMHRAELLNGIAHTKGKVS